MGKHQQDAQQVNDVELALDTLTGDVRDALLTHIRSMENPWSKMSERAQQEKIDAVSNMGRSLVTRAAYIVGARGFEHLGITIGKFTAKDGTLKAEFETAQTHLSLVALADMQGRRSLLVLVDPDEYDGEKEPAKPDKDQPELAVAAE